MRLLYDLAIRLFVSGMHLAAFFHPKARLWVKGRSNWRERYRFPEREGTRAKLLWVHAASLGEFEQGRPVIESFREQHPDGRILLTFFSPSGYEIRKNYPYADLVCYLPADTRRNAADFMDLFQPDAAIFVKYEFWGNYLFELKKRGIPTLLVSALFREKQPFFKWYGGFWRKMLGCFTHFFVQNEVSANLLRGIGFQNATVAGDTRVDRVINIASQVTENEVVARFCAPQPPHEAEAIGSAHLIAAAPRNLCSDGFSHDFGGAAHRYGCVSVRCTSEIRVCSHYKSFDALHLLEPIASALMGGPGGASAFIVGSSWEADENILLPVFETPDFQEIKIIIAPHEPSEANVLRLCGQLKDVLRYSQAATNLSDSTVLSDEYGSKWLVIDNVGMLNQLYRYGSIAYIGGGFGKGIHNTLEPAAFGLPIIFGPKYENFEEARQFVARGGAFPVHNSEELAVVLKKLQDPVFYQQASEAVRGYLEESRGATKLVMVFLNRL